MGVTFHTDVATGTLPFVKYMTPTNDTEVNPQLNVGVPQLNVEGHKQKVGGRLGGQGE